jgi:cyclophilin family peptidyl-prolyl cis-trans isomerase
MKHGFLLLIGFIAVMMASPLAGEQAPDKEKKEPEVKKPQAPTPPVAEEKKSAPNPVVKMNTTKGEILIELNAEKAPITVENFLNYTNDGFYNGTVFHRVIKGFMIQGGGFTADMRQKKTNPPIKNESYNKLRNQRGTIAMARTSAPDSATSQFFINHVDNRSLDFDGPYKPGYAVFGKVIKGMDVVDAIAAVSTQRLGSHANVPVEPVVIESVSVVEKKDVEADKAETNDKQ